MNVKEKLLDRMEQSFFIYKKWFLELTLPFFIYTFVWFYLIPVILISVIWPVFFSYYNNWNDIYNYYLLYLFTLPILFLVIFYIFSYMFVFILTLKNIIFYFKNYENPTKNNLKQKIIDSRKSMIKILKTYWYIFAYVALIPALFFIVWWILFNATYFLELPEYFSRVWTLLMLTWIVLFIFFSIYRWVKTTFSLYSAIKNDEYTKQNFKNSVKITDWIWWRIFWNTFISWLIIWLFLGVITNILKIFIPSWFNFYEASLTWNFSLLSWLNFLIYWIFESVINSISIVYLMVFVYLLYERILLERNISNPINPDNSDEEKNSKKIEL